MSWVYFLKHKSKVFDVFVKFYNMLITQFQTQPQMLRLDRGGTHQLRHPKFLFISSLIHQTTCLNTPQQSGVTERKNRTLLEITQALMFKAHIPTHFRPEAIVTPTY